VGLPRLPSRLRLGLAPSLPVGTCRFHVTAGAPGREPVAAPTIAAEFLRTLHLPAVPASLHVLAPLSHFPRGKPRGCHMALPSESEARVFWAYWFAGCKGCSLLTSSILSACYQVRYGTNSLTRRMSAGRRIATQRKGFNMKRLQRAAHRWAALSFKVPSHSLPWGLRRNARSGGRHGGAPRFLPAARQPCDRRSAAWASTGGRRMACAWPQKQSFLAMPLS
jgi:hypothetical protein